MKLSDKELELILDDWSWGHEPHGDPDRVRAHIQAITQERDHFKARAKQWEHIAEDKDLQLMELYSQRDELREMLAHIPNMAKDDYATWQAWYDDAKALLEKIE